MAAEVPAWVLRKVEELREELAIGRRDSPEPIEVVQMPGGGVLEVWFDGTETLYGPMMERLEEVRREIREMLGPRLRGGGEG